MNADQPAEFRAGQAILDARTGSVSFVRIGKRCVARAVCGACGSKQEDESSPDRLGAQQMVALFTAQGWNFDAMNHGTCPHCARGYRPKSNAPKPETPTMSTPITAAPGSVPCNDNQPRDCRDPAPPSRECRDPSPKELRAIFAALEDNFLDGIWSNGMSDAGVAAELDVPRRMVEKIRIGAFGHVRNADLDQLKADANQLREEFKARLADLFHRLAKLEAQAPK